MLEYLTFRRTRRAAGRLALRWPVLNVAGWWALSLVSLAIYANLRGRMDDVGLPVHGSELGTGVLGSLPTVWLQGHIYTLAPDPLEWLAVVIHASWFFVPLLAAVFVSWRRPARIGSFFRWWISLQALALACFALFPLRPPWLEDHNVIRIIALAKGGKIEDSNALAAMPSLHVAFPLLIGLWFLRERWRLPGLLMGAYSGLVAVEVVFSGEHYVVDVAGAGLIAVVIAFGSRVDLASAVGALRPQRAPAAVWRRLRARAPAIRGARRAVRSERGQAVMELALVLPLLFVFLFTVVEFGIALERSLSYAHAAREGTRAAAVGSASTLAQVQSKVEESGGCTQSASCTIQVNWMDDTGDGKAGDVGDSVQVKITDQYQFVTPLQSLLGAFGVDPITMTLGACAEMRQEQKVTATAGASICQ